MNQSLFCSLSDLPRPCDILCRPELALTWHSLNRKTGKSCGPHSVSVSAHLTLRRLLLILLVLILGAKLLAAAKKRRREKLRAIKRKFREKCRKQKK